MIHEKWFISDTHFFHENIIQYCHRPFANADLMNSEMVKNWNRVVGPNDNVYHLGDVACGYGGDESKLASLLFALNGRKRLIVGNHDHIKSPTLHKVFEKIELWKGFKKENFTITHIPLRIENLRDGNYCVHGHLHNNTVGDPHYLNICVEHTEYTPIHMDAIIGEIKQRES